MIYLVQSLWHFVVYGGVGGGTGGAYDNLNSGLTQFTALKQDYFLRQ